MKTTNNVIPKFPIGSKVKLLNDTIDNTYIVYSYTVYKDNSISYLLWLGDDYNSYFEWQILEYIEPSPIGFTK